MRNILTWSDSLNNLDKVLDYGKLYTKKIVSYEEYSHDVYFKSKVDLQSFMFQLKALKTKNKR